MLVFQLIAICFKKKQFAHVGYEQEIPHFIIYNNISAGNNHQWIKPLWKS